MPTDDPLLNCRLPTGSYQGRALRVRRLDRAALHGFIGKAYYAFSQTGCEKVAPAGQFERAAGCL